MPLTAAYSTLSSAGWVRGLALGVLLLATDRSAYNTLSWGGGTGGGALDWTCNRRRERVIRGGEGVKCDRYREGEEKRKGRETGDITWLLTEAYSTACSLVGGGWGRLSLEAIDRSA